MTKIYQDFSELAEAMCEGNGTLHLFNCAQHDGIESPCVAWQMGVETFAAWLDHLGIKVGVSDEAEDFYVFSTKHRKELSAEPESKDM